MIDALAATFGRVAVVCLGASDLPPVEQTGDFFIHRMSGGSDLLHRATLFSAFVEQITARYASTLRHVAFRDPWGGVPLLKRLPSCPSLFEVNALPSWELAYSFPAVQQSPALMAKIGDMERFCLRRATSVLCVSHVTRRALESHGVNASRLTVIGNSAAEHFFEQPLAAQPVAALHSGQWIGYVGGLQSWQGIDTLLDAWALLGADLPEHRLLILHSGNRETRFIDRRLSHPNLRGRVLLHGPVAPTELGAVFERLQFTVAPLVETTRNTWQGCCPIKIVESMAAGRTVIASDLAVTRELIDHGRDGVLVPPGDPRSLALAIGRLASDEPFRVRLSAGARSKAHAEFRRESAHEKLKSLFLRTAEVSI
jgi:glycosyltransferase involved in cell wall biosynthesis